MSDARDECHRIIKKLRDVDGVLGACLASRDGRAILAEWTGTANLDTLAAMGAALMGAGETALVEFGGQTGESVLLVAPDVRLSVLGVDDELLLLAAMDRKAPLDPLDQSLAAALEQIREALR